MAQQLPLIPSEANYEFSTVLDDVPYIVGVRWNGREGKWYMDLFEEDGTAIRRGMAVVLGTLIGGRSASAKFPEGTFSANDLSGDDADAGFDDLGERVQVWFVPESDIDAATDTNASVAGFGGVEIPTFPS